MFRPRPYLSFSQMTLFEVRPEEFIEKYIHGKKERETKNMKYGSMLANGLMLEEATGDPLLDLVMAKLPKLEVLDFPVIDPKGTTVPFNQGGKEIMVSVPVLENGKDPIPLMAVPDSLGFTCPSCGYNYRDMIYSIRPLPKTSIVDEKRTNALLELSQENPNIPQWNKHCETCHGEPYIRMLEYKTSVRKWTQRMADKSSQITFYATAIWLTTGKIPDDIELINAQVEYDEEGRLRPTGDILRFPTKRTMVDVIKMTARIKKIWVGIQDICEKELI